jgi:hypothetical protein
MPLITAFNLRKEDRLSDIENALRRALVSTPELKINDDEIDFVPILTPDGFSRPGDQDQRGSVGRKSSHKGSASRAGRESRHSLSTCHWIGSKSEGRHSALRCRGVGVGVGFAQARSVDQPRLAAGQSGFSKPGFPRAGHRPGRLSDPSRGIQTRHRETLWLRHLRSARLAEGVDIHPGGERNEPAR